MRQAREKESLLEEADGLEVSRRRLAEEAVRQEQLAKDLLAKEKKERARLEAAQKEADQKEAARMAAETRQPGGRPRRRTAGPLHSPPHPSGGRLTSIGPGSLLLMQKDPTPVTKEDYK